jgi:diacylglycerol kinase (ATP)
MDTTPHNNVQPPGILSVGLISNPHSGRNRKHLDTIRKIVTDYPNVHHRTTQTADDIPAVLEAFARQPVDILAINGGDGTIARILTELLERGPFPVLPRLALLPGGTTNMNAADVGLRGNLVKAIRRLCTWSSGAPALPESLQRPVLRVTGGDGQAAVCGMAFGAGAITRGVEYSDTSINRKGIVGAFRPALALFRTLWGLASRDRRFFKPVAISLQRDNEPADPACDILILIISSLERLMLGSRPFWGQESAPLHTSLVHADAERFLRNLPAMARGKPNRHMTEANGYSSHNASRIRLAMDGSWMLDGEVHEARISDGPVTISNGGDVTFVRL